mmetsp:Transcript_22862/g.50155  ORF Transcript_22862/g.50155 Transcript_22862/m.50155 type:complete len:347 (-) Transcript_22862:162-1202(-)|eukprot:CAMPEP_0118941412 /NCGR_PEP_ID=MMETSP1169-20130426/33802_1 /TAXON_ID=36882 /ORGANISM="Pyramimonas obovata, Strain CCMP722" /LENGTH=346 /DNA_ID=CAMNT_0006886153 /DNA_START=29 /DNA_END=1069 /DNA_ORIENTATION=+
MTRDNVMKAAILLSVVAVATLPQVALGKDERWEIAKGVYMPEVSLGHPDPFGTGNETASAMKWFELGGTGIDTAYNYHNQDQVGAGFRASGVPRETAFITSKITCPPDEISPSVTPEGALAAVEVCLRELQLDYVDLMLLHFPCKTGHQDTIKAWKGLQEAHAKGLVRAIGVSNFKQADLDAVLSVGGTPPAVNQVLFSIGMHDDALLAYTASLGARLEAYSPLRHVDFEAPALKAAAAAHGKSAAQVALRWVNQQGVLLATSPGENVDFIKADLELHSFTLSDEEMKALGAIEAPPLTPPPPAAQTSIDILDKKASTDSEQTSTTSPARALGLGAPGQNNGRQTV